MHTEQNLSKPQWETFWGLLITLFVGFVIFILFSLLQSVFILAYGFYLRRWDFNYSPEIILENLAFNGDAISIAEIPAASIGVFLILIFTLLRKPISINHFLQLKLSSVWGLIKWLVVMALIIIAMQFSYEIFQRNTPDFMIQTYHSTNNFPLLWLAVIVAAPVFEEFLFRGYLFEGIRCTPVGSIGAILITAASWALIHIQYESFEKTTIFFIGIAFAIAKLKTRSLFVPIAMHMLMNLTATIMMEVG